MLRCAGKAVKRGIVFNDAASEEQRCAWEYVMLSTPFCRPWDRQHSRESVVRCTARQEREISAVARVMALLREVVPESAPSTRTLWVTTSFPDLSSARSISPFTVTF